VGVGEARVESNVGCKGHTPLIECPSASHAPKNKTKNKKTKNIINKHLITPSMVERCLMFSKNKNSTRKTDQQTNTQQALVVSCLLHIVDTFSLIIWIPPVLPVHNLFRTDEIKLSIALFAPLLPSLPTFVQINVFTACLQTAAVGR
jgi:hypothetical protein